jgi:hypothetical protein
MVGNGAQLSSMVGITLVFALMGFLSPSNRGSLATVMMVCWTFFGGYVFSCSGHVHLYLLIDFLDRIGGYFSSRVYASLGGTNRRKNAFLTAVLLPTLAMLRTSEDLTDNLFVEPYLPLYSSLTSSCLPQDHQALCHLVRALPTLQVRKWF